MITATRLQQKRERKNAMRAEHRGRSSTLLFRHGSFMGEKIYRWERDNRGRKYRSMPADFRREVEGISRKKIGVNPMTLKGFPSVSSGRKSRRHLKNK